MNFQINKKGNCCTISYFSFLEIHTKEDEIEYCCAWDIYKKKNKEKTNKNLKKDN